MIEVIVKEHELQIYIDRIKMREWLGITSMNDIPWEAPTEDEKNSIASGS